MTTTVYREQQILALLSVLKPDVDYMVRRIFRWYSQVFHTPLHVVGELPLEDVLQAYYESLYEQMDEEKLEPIRLKLSTTEEEIEEQRDEDEEWIRELEESMQAQEAQQAAKAAAAPKIQAPGRNLAKETQLPEANQAPPPDISLRFTDAGGLEDLIREAEKRGQ